MLTRFEEARIIGARSLQLSQGAPVLIKVPKGMSRVNDIVKRELSEGVLPISVVRYMPGGEMIVVGNKGEQLD
jgi:DNA-directed RNA polymerase I, II, and III subunit RPABC2